MIISNYFWDYDFNTIRKYNAEIKELINDRLDRRLRG